jgi:hypothetical protein
MGWTVGTFARPARLSARERSEYPGECPERGKGAGTPPNKERAGEGSFATAPI